MKSDFINHFFLPSSPPVSECTLHIQMFVSEREIQNVLHLSTSNFLKDPWETNYAMYNSIFSSQIQS